MKNPESKTLKKRTLKVLKGKLVTLKPLKKIYFKDYLKMFSPKVRELLHAYSGESELEYLEDRLEKQKMGKTFFYCIFLCGERKTGDDPEHSSGKTLVGAIEIRNPQETDSQLYSWVNENYWGTGVYQEALALVSKEYFSKTSEICYRANVDIDNPRSYYALKKHGFIDSGIKKGSHGKQYKLILRKK
ncbi:GNAT family N-acetyltransferase [Candidatus Dependentiae bacterium]